MLDYLYLCLMFATPHLGPFASRIRFLLDIDDFSETSAESLSTTVCLERKSSVGGVKTMSSTLEKRCLYSIASVDGKLVKFKEERAGGGGKGLSLSLSLHVDGAH